MRLLRLESALRVIDMLINPRNLERFTRQEIESEAREMIKDRYCATGDTVEACPKCMEWSNDNSGAGMTKRWVSTEGMSPSRGLYHLCGDGEYSKGQWNCTHLYAYKAVCGESFTQFIDSGD